MIKKVYSERSSDDPSRAKLEKRGDLYYPDKETKKRAWVNDAKIYGEALKSPVKFWEKLAKELLWFKPWKKGFLHKPPYFQWFVDGKINITSNIFEKDWEKRRDKVAVIWEPEPIEEKPRLITYSELFDDVCRCANYLRELGVKKGDRVGVYMPMIPQIITVMLACARIGAIHSVVFSAFSPTALRVRLQDTGAKVLVTADKYFRRGQEMNLLDNAKEGAKDTKVKEIVVVQRNGNQPWQAEKNSCKAAAMDSEDIQFILYTSGSTGKPKGCVHVCGGYTVQAYWTGKWIFDFHDKDIFWCTSDPGWVTGHTYTIYSPLLNGITTLMFEGAPDFPMPDRWAKIIEKHKVTIFYTAPTAIRMFEKLNGNVGERYQFNSLRLLGSVGEPIDESAWLWYYKNVGKERCPIVDTWWQTETGGILISSLPGIGPFKPAFTGIPFPGVKVDIKDGSLVILPPFAPSLLRGIYRNPLKYSETYWSQYGNSVYFTSDGASKDENGLIRIIGRVDDVIKVAGHRVSTGELEAAVNVHQDITECAVIGIPDKIKGEVPVAFIVYSGQKNQEEVKKEVVLYIQKAIGPIALPKEVYLVEDLPKTRSGKIMRRILRKLFTGEDVGDLSTLANPQSVEKIRLMINKKPMFKKAFTLIELMVVVAIVGLLASIILLNTQKTRFQAHDAQIQSSMHQLRNAAEMSYDANENYDEVCDEANNTVSDAGEFGLLERDIRDDNGNQNVVCYESADKKDFAASSPLRTQAGKHWCIESAGVSIEINNPITSSVCQ